MALADVTCEKQEPAAFVYEKGTSGFHILCEIVVHWSTYIDGFLFCLILQTRLAGWKLFKYEMCLRNKSSMKIGKDSFSARKICFAVRKIIWFFELVYMDVKLQLNLLFVMKFIDLKKKALVLSYENRMESYSRFLLFHSYYLKGRNYCSFYGFSP